jgi:hypothetical protein
VIERASGSLISRTALAAVLAGELGSRRGTGFSQENSVLAGELGSRRGTGFSQENSVLAGEPGLTPEAANLKDGRGRRQTRNAPSSLLLWNVDHAQSTTVPGSSPSADVPGDKQLAAVA